MIDERVRDDLALIRDALDNGRRYATACGPAMVVWGVLLAAGFVGTYAFVCGEPTLSPAPLWSIVIAVGWAFSLYQIWTRIRSGASGVTRSPTVNALRMVWLGLGIFLTTLALAALWSGDMRLGWLSAVNAGAIGMAVFATASLTSLPWLRWVAFAWWAGELVLYGLRYRPEALLVLAAMMLLLLAGPGLVLVARRQKMLAPA
jgi:hypothetical protein